MEIINFFYNINKLNMNLITQSLSKSQFFAKVKTDMKIYSNITCILEKVEQDGNLILLENTISKVIQREIIFTISGILKRIEKNERIKSNNRYDKSIIDKYINV